MTVGSQVLRIGTRASRLARWQTDQVVRLIGNRRPALACVVVPMATEGDGDVRTPLPEIGGRGVFSEALEQALLGGGIDLAVHSLKDLPVEETPGLSIAATCCREDPRDVMISRERWTLATLPSAAVVGTCSTRRQAQLLAARPDLDIRPLRGNVDTRVRRALDGDYGAIVIAAAGVLRLGLGASIAEYLSLDAFLPAPGQGALAIQCRGDDEATREVVSALDEPDVRAAVDAERTFLAALGGGCSAPIAAFGRVERSGPAPRLHLAGLVGSRDGRRMIRVAGEADVEQAAALGRRLADAARAQGAAALLA